jgi:hypothetical protein
MRRANGRAETGDPTDPGRDPGVSPLDKSRWFLASVADGHGTSAIISTLKSGLWRRLDRSGGCAHGTNGRSSAKRGLLHRLATVVPFVGPAVSDLAPVGCMDGWLCCTPVPQPASSTGPPCKLVLGKCVTLDDWKRKGSSSWIIVSGNVWPNKACLRKGSVAIADHLPDFSRLLLTSQIISPSKLSFTHQVVVCNIWLILIRINM